MPLYIHRSERADSLAAQLAALLAQPLADPFVADVVAVGESGMQRWLCQQLSGLLGASDQPGTGRGDDGICANIRFVTPTAMVTQVVAAASNLAADEDPWAPPRLVWTVLQAVDSSLDRPWCTVLARHVGEAADDSDRAGRRLATAQRITALFGEYARQRPNLLAQWAAGSDTDGCGGSVPPDLLWQPQLWRAVRAALGVPSPAERLTPTCDRLRTDPRVVDLPPRLSVFAMTRAPADQLAVLAALAEHRDVHLWLVRVSAAVWPAVTEADAAADVSAVAHPLSAALGQDARQLRLRLATLPAVLDLPGDCAAMPAEDSETRSATLLSVLQDGIREDRWPPHPDPAPADGTVQIHACHGPARQVEILRDVLAQVFVDDPQLQPRDVVVLCPDVSRYAPLLRAAFGAWHHENPSDQRHPAHQLRVRVAERSPLVADPVLAVLEQVLALAAGRVTVTEVLDLAASEPVRRRCGFDDDDLERLRQWAAETGARWGIGKRQRAAFGLGDFPQHTINAAVDRILLGVAAGESSEDWLDVVLPLDDVDSADVDLAGRFAEFIDRLAVCLREVCGPSPDQPAGAPRPASAWAQVLDRVLDLLTEVPAPQSWQAGRARTQLREALAHAGEVPLRLPDIVALLADAAAGGRRRSAFRTGDLTVCELRSLRHVPHPVVVLLGLDDDIFGRGSTLDGESVLARAPVAGEDDSRSEDRQLLLDAIMAAQRRLVILYTGADAVTGARRPPAVPLAQLLDVLAAHLGPNATVVTRHPLQGFDPRAFAAARPASFDTVALGAARAAMVPAREPVPFLPNPLPEPALADIELSELVAFAEHPVRAFLGQRLGIRVPGEEEEIEQRMPIEVDGLTRWTMGERMLAARASGVAPDALRAAEWRRGTLPPFGFGAQVLDEVALTVDRLVQVTQPLTTQPARVVDVLVDLGDGRMLSGSVAQVHGNAVVRTTFSRLAPRHRIAAWVQVLALAAAQPEHDWQAVTLGRGRFGRPTWRVTVTAPRDMAVQLLRDIIRLRDMGLREPLPIAPTASAVYAQRRWQGATVDQACEAAEEAFGGGAGALFGDFTDRSLRYVWGPQVRLRDWHNQPAEGDGAGERTRFGELARLMWDPVLANESQGPP